MIDAWGVWLLLVGFAVGAGMMLVLLVRLPRADDDVDPPERRSEAAWIAADIERRGGVAPAPLVDEVLGLHAAYLRLQRPPRPPSGQAAGGIVPAPVDPWHQPAPHPGPPHAGPPHPGPSQPGPPVGRRP